MSVGIAITIVLLLLIYISLGVYFYMYHIRSKPECPQSSMSDGKYTIRASNKTQEYTDVFLALHEWEEEYPECPIPKDWIDSHIDKQDCTGDDCDQIEFEEPPDDTVESFEIQDYFSYQPNENFRIIRTSPDTGEPVGSGGSGVISTRGRGYRHTMDNSHTLQRWPRMYRRRPWKTYWWRSYPSYVHAYPLTYYDDAWEVPVERFTIRMVPNNRYAVGKSFTKDCGEPQAQIDLVYGHSYEFDIFTQINCVNGMESYEPFVFTTEPRGGGQSIDNMVFNTKPTTNGIVRITVTNDTPSVFYYQSTNSKDVGGVVYVHY